MPAQLKAKYYYKTNWMELTQLYFNYIHYIVQCDWICVKTIIATFHPTFIKMISDIITVAHCAFSSNLFHGQIVQILIDQLSPPENKKCSP